VVHKEGNPTVIQPHTSCRYAVIDVSPVDGFADYRIFAVHSLDDDEILGSEVVHGPVDTLVYRRPALIMLQPGRVTLLCANYKAAHNVVRELREQDLEAMEANA
jgi:hypothetical protein